MLIILPSFTGRTLSTLAVEDQIWNTVAVVHQLYQTDVAVEHVIRANSALLKCSIPSFVADYVSVESWTVDDQDLVDRFQSWGKNPPRHAHPIPNPNHPTRCANLGTATRKRSRPPPESTASSD